MLNTHKPKVNRILRGEVSIPPNNKLLGILTHDFMKWKISEGGSIVINVLEE